MGLFGIALASTTGGVLATPYQTAVLRDTFGEVGLIEMPSGHMAPDGTFGANVGDVGSDYQRYAVYFQALPWLDTSFRYSRVAGWLTAPYYYDRSFGVKLRLLREENSFADVSLGIRDILGTGVYGSEYLVASKHIGPFDVTAGLGWGRLGSNGTFSNPFGKISQSFDSRSLPTTIGSFDTKQFFHGPSMGVFAGVQWDTPVDGLRLMAEYSSDEYTTERAYPHGLRTKLPVNIAASYSVTPSISITTGWLYGATYGFTITVDSNVKQSTPTALRIGPAVPSGAIRTDEEKQEALSVLRTYRTTRAGGSVVAQPPPLNLPRQRLLEALHSLGRDIRNVEIADGTVTVDTRLGASPDRQCDQITQIVATSSVAAKNVVIADTQDTRGHTYFCKTPAAMAVNLAPLTIGSNNSPIEQTVASQLAQQDIALAGLYVGVSEAWVYIENNRYRSTAQAVGRVARVLMSTMPADIEIFHIVPTSQGMAQQSITVYRSSLERTLMSQTAFYENSVSLTPAPISPPPLLEVPSKAYPSLSWSVDPKMAQHVFDPDDPIEFMFYGDASAMLQILPGLSLTTELTGTIWSNYKFLRGADSDLPHVRTELLKYLEHGKYGIANLQLSYRTRVARTVFAEVRGGLLEDMFMGFGGQVLWRPQNSNFAFGADIYQVWQRGYKRLFDSRDYHVVTGHVSAYYHSPWYDLNYAVHVGQYLAGDRGATFEITRRFATGVEIGAWATFTNVPSSKFGEGSFDKGLILHIPLEWSLPISTQSAYDLRLASLTRDGGQRLGGDNSLFDATQANSRQDITEHLNEIVDP